MPAIKKIDHSQIKRQYASRRGLPEATHTPFPPDTGRRLHRHDADSARPVSAV